MSKKVRVGFVVFFILLIGITAFFALTDGTNYFSYKSYLRSIEQNDLQKSNNDLDISSKNYQGTSSNGLDNNGVPNPGNSSSAGSGDDKASTNTTNTIPGNSSTSNEKNGESYDYINFTRYLGKGSVGNDVKKLQYLLKKMNLYSANIDGIFGSITYNAVISYQMKNNLYVDGIAGTNTFSKLLKGPYNSQ